MANPRLIKGAFSALELDRLVDAARVLHVEAQLRNKSASTPSFGLLAERLGGHRSDVQTRYAWLKLQRSRANLWLLDEDRVLVKLVERPEERQSKSMTWCVVASAVSAAKLTSHARTALCCRERVQELLANPALFRRASLRYCDSSTPLPTMEQLGIAADAPLPASQPWRPTEQQVAEAHKRLYSIEHNFAQPSDGAPSSSSQERGSLSPPTTPPKKRAMKRAAPTAATAISTTKLTASTPLPFHDGASVTPLLDPSLSVVRSRSDDLDVSGKRKRTPSWRMRDAMTASISRPQSTAAEPSASATMAASALAALAAFVEDQFFGDTSDDDEIPLSRLSVPMSLPMPPSLKSSARLLQPLPSLHCDEHLVLHY